MSTDEVSSRQPSPQEGEAPPQLNQWIRAGDPWIWLTAGAVTLSLVAVVGLLLLLAVRGLGHFWPANVVAASYAEANGQIVPLLGEIIESEEVSGTRARDSGYAVTAPHVTRLLIKLGNRDSDGQDFRTVLAERLTDRRYPLNVMVLERREWGNFYGFLAAVKEQGRVVASGEQAWPVLQERLARALALFEEIRTLERGSIGTINYAMERLRLKERRLTLDDALTAEAQAELTSSRAELENRYTGLQETLTQLYSAIKRDTLVGQLADGREVEISLAKVVRAYRPNEMGTGDKIGSYLTRFWEFVSDEPRESNTEGGIFPAIFGTVLMVLIMAILVTPMGVMAAVYLREYAKQGPLTRLIRIAVNNLAGVPSVVYGVFGLGFFVYFLGGRIDQTFFPEALPSPTFGTPGLLWSSLTLALLTLPVVIVATEEGLTRIPRAIREGSLALGATQAETLWRVVLPMAAPGMMTGLILAVARAAGEVAPLMMVGVVKLAPALPLDGNFPYLHLDRKLMHMGFHIYDVGFQSPNVEAARPLVYATAFLLVMVIVVLNLAAIRIRSRLRERYRSTE